MHPRFLVPVVTIIAVAGCYQTPQSTLAAGERGRISVADQPASGAVLIDEIGMPSTGWVVLHPVRDGVPDTSATLGRAYVPAGPSSGTTVPLSAPVRPGQQVAAMLHLDTGNATVFEFGNGSPEALDPPVLIDGQPVATVITLR